MKIYQEIPNLVIMEQKCRALYRKAKYIVLVTATWNRRISDVSYWDCVRLLFCVSVHLYQRGFHWAD
jgi:hypothetical protein